MEAKQQRTRLGPIDFRNLANFVGQKQRWQKNERDPLPKAFSAVKKMTKVTAFTSARRRAISRQLEDLYYSKLFLQNDHCWVGERPLGAGSFGTVGLFQKQDGSGKIVDRVVVKTTKAYPGAAVSGTRLGQSALPIEAEIMRQTNSIRDDSILFMRQFKSFPVSQEWRFYLEYAPYGDLWRLRNRYRAWGTFLPEIFLLHIFKWLVSACFRFEHGPFAEFQGPRAGEPIKDGYLLHCDIKEENSFLGYASRFPNYQLLDYPMPKQADFGLAQIERPESETARPIYLRKGTRVWFPPELREQHFNINPYYDFFWDDIPEAIKSQWKAGLSLPRTRDQHRVGPYANLFCVGMLMLCLMSLRSPAAVSEYIEHVLSTGTIGTNDSLMPELIALSPAAAQIYSAEFVDMIRDCMRILPSKRPNIGAVYNSTNREIAKCWQKLDHQYHNNPDGLAKATYVYFRENEINNMPRGPHQFELGQIFWEELDEDEVWQDPNWPRLNPPYHPDRQRLLNRRSFRDELDQLMLDQLPSNGPAETMRHQELRERAVPRRPGVGSDKYKLSLPRWSWEDREDPWTE